MDIIFKIKEKAPQKETLFAGKTLYQGLDLWVVFDKQNDLRASGFYPDFESLQRKYPSITQIKEAPLAFSKAHIEGTLFQIEVWKVLLSIPAGKTITYQNVSHVLGRRSAARACGNAIGQNLLCPFIPCHRVVSSKKKNLGGFAFGSEMKKKLLAFEGVTF